MNQAGASANRHLNEVVAAEKRPCSVQLWGQTRVPDGLTTWSGDFSSLHGKGEGKSWSGEGAAARSALQSHVLLGS